MRYRSLSLSFEETPLKDPQSTLKLQFLSDVRSLWIERAAFDVKRLNILQLNKQSIINVMNNKVSGATPLPQPYGSRALAVESVSTSLPFSAQ